MSASLIEVLQSISAMVETRLQGFVDPEYAQERFTIVDVLAFHPQSAHERAEILAGQRHRHRAEEIVPQEDEEYTVGPVWQRLPVVRRRHRKKKSISMTVGRLPDGFWDPPTDRRSLLLSAHIPIRLPRSVTIRMSALEEFQRDCMVPIGSKGQRVGHWRVLAQLAREFDIIDFVDTLMSAHA